MSGTRSHCIFPEILQFESIFAVVEHIHCCLQFLPHLHILLIVLHHPCLSDSAHCCLSFFCFDFSPVRFFFVVVNSNEFVFSIFLHFSISRFFKFNISREDYFSSFSILQSISFRAISYEDEFSASIVQFF